MSIARRSRSPRDTQRPEFAVGFRYVDPSDRFRSVRLLSERKRQFRQASFDAIRFDVREVLTVHARCALVGAALGVPSRPSHPLAGVRLLIPEHVMGFPVLRALSLCTCCRHYPDAANGLRRRSNSPAQFSLPRIGGRVGLHIGIFEICSAFTHVAACTLARSPT